MTTATIPMQMLVTSGGRLRFPPLLAVSCRQISPGAATRLRHHAGVDIVCVMLGGALAVESATGERRTLGADDVALLATGTGIAYRWRAVGAEPAYAVMF